MKTILRLTLGCRDVLLDKTYYEILEERSNAYLVRPIDSTEYFTLDKSKIGVPLQGNTGKIYYVLHTTEDDKKIEEIKNYIQSAILYRNRLNAMIDKFNKDIDQLNTLIKEAEDKLTKIGGRY